jgi:small subunit ribosomal protein S20
MIFLLLRQENILIRNVACPHYGCFRKYSIPPKKRERVFTGGKSLAVHKSVMKRARQNSRARERNRSWKSRIRTQQKRIEKALEKKEKDTLGDLYSEYCSLVDKAASRRIIHRNTASRKKMRMNQIVQNITVPLKSSPPTGGEPSKKVKPAAPQKPEVSLKVADSGKKKASSKPSASKKVKRSKETKASKEEMTVKEVKATGKPEVSTKTEASGKKKVSEKPEVSGKQKVAKEPETSEKAEASRKPRASVKQKATGKPEVSEKQKATKSSGSGKTAPDSSESKGKKRTASAKKTEA